MFPLLSALHEEDYRLWYDEGIDPGNEWPDEVAKALLSASHFLVFLTGDAVKSQNVKNEIHFALNRSKPFLAVYLEETQLPLALELRMGDIQAIMKWRMSDEQFHRKLIRSLPDGLRRAESGDSPPKADAVPRIITKEPRQTQEPSLEDLIARLKPTYAIKDPRQLEQELADLGMAPDDADILCRALFACGKCTFLEYVPAGRDEEYSFSIQDGYMLEGLGFGEAKAKVAEMESQLSSASDPAFRGTIRRHLAEAVGALVTVSVPCSSNGEFTAKSNRLTKYRQVARVMIDRCVKESFNFPTGLD